MKFLTGIIALILAAGVVCGGILWATGNIQIVADPAGEAINRAVNFGERHLPKGSNQFRKGGNIAANTASISPQEAAKRLADLRIRHDYDPELPHYDREEWGSWRDLNQDCRNTRADVLERESSEKVRFPNGCIASTGQWQDPWSNRTFQEASKLDVDHHVPLANAHYSGGHAWSTERKQEYYNDTRLPVALNAISKDDNRAKGARGPERWQPEQRRCSYAAGWVAVKSKYGLSVTKAERKALANMLSTCPKPD